MRAEGARHHGGDEARGVALAAGLEAGLTGDIPPEGLRYEICQRMGWTFQDYDEAHWGDIVALAAYMSGRARGQTSRLPPPVPLPGDEFD